MSTARFSLLFLLVSLLFPFYVFSQAAQAVTVVADTSPTFIESLIYQAETAGQMLETAQNTLQAVEYQRQALRSLDDWDMEEFAEFMSLQSKSSAALSSSFSGVMASKELLKYAGPGKTKSPEIYNSVVAASNKETAQSSIKQELDYISDTEWNTSVLMTDIDNYEKKAEARQRQYNNVKRDSKTVGQLQTVNQLLTIVADQNEDTISLLKSSNYYHGQQQKLEQQKAEYEKTQSGLETSRAAEVPQGFGKGIFGDGNIDIQSQTEERLRAYAQQGERGL